MGCIKRNCFNNFSFLLIILAVVYSVILIGWADVDFIKYKWRSIKQFTFKIYIIRN